MELTKMKNNLLYEDLSYELRGSAIEVRKSFGPGHKEIIYQNAFAEELVSRGLKFEKEKSIRIYSPKTGKFIGLYKPDFIIEDKVIVEIKAVDIVPKNFIDQLYSYLRNSEYQLGIFINFKSPELYIKRIIYTNDRKVFLNSVKSV
jgi:GxxExxY protein